MGKRLKAAEVVSDRTVEAVLDEAERQADRFGAQADIGHEAWIVVMAEELGETARAVLHEGREGRPVEMASREELIQLAAITLRGLEVWEVRS